MTATDTDARPQPGGPRWARWDTRWEVSSETRWRLSAALLGVLASVGTARADVLPQTMNGVPLLPIPTYEDIGTWTFRSLADTVTLVCRYESTQAAEQVRLTPDVRSCRQDARSFA